MPVTTCQSHPEEVEHDHSNDVSAFLLMLFVRESASPLLLTKYSVSTCSIIYKHTISTTGKNKEHERTLPFITCISEISTSAYALLYFSI